MKDNLRKPKVTGPVCDEHTLHTCKCADTGLQHNGGEARTTLPKNLQEAVADIKCSPEIMKISESRSSP